MYFPVVEYSKVNRQVINNGIWTERGPIRSVTLLHIVLTISLFSLVPLHPIDYSETSIKRTPFIKWTLSLVPKLASYSYLYDKPLHI